MNKSRVFSLIFSLYLFIACFSQICYAEKSMWDHTVIWGKAALQASGVNPLAKLGGVAGKGLASIFKPQSVESWSQWGEGIEKGRQRIDDVNKKLQSPTGVGFLVWGAVTTAEVGSAILKQPYLR